MIPWTLEDQNAALAEGWGVFDISGHLRIKCTVDTFDLDAEAIQHVQDKAKAGSELHRRALIAVGRTVPA